MLLATGLAACTLAMAQEGRGHESRDRDPEARLERMTRQLDLNTEQQARILALWEAQAEKRQAVQRMENTEERRAAMRESMRTTRQAVQEVLTPEQRERMHELRRTGPHGEGTGMDPEARAEKRTERMTQALDLSAEQAARIRELLVQHGRKMEAIRGQQQDPEVQKSALKEVRRSQERGVQAVLTPEQQERWKELSSKGMQQGRMKERPRK
jgi:Spy/CpxP family protein refolding chaperone